MVSFTQFSSSSLMPVCGLLRFLKNIWISLLDRVAPSRIAKGGALSLARCSRG